MEVRSDGGAWWALAVVGSVLAGAHAVAARSAPLTVADAIESTRAMTDESLNAVFPSPDGRRYVVVLIRGDVKRDGVWVEVLRGGLTSLEAARPVVVTSLFTRGLGTPGGMGEDGGAPHLLAPRRNIPVWLDSEHVALRWEKGAGATQVLSIDVNDGSFQSMTRHSGAAMGFVRSARGALLYEASVRYPRTKSDVMLEQGFAVTSPDAMPLLGGYVDGAAASDFGNCERYAILPGIADGVHLAPGTSVFCQLSFLTAPPGGDASTLSSDGRWALLNVSVDAIPPGWRRYTQDDFVSLLRVREHSPKHLYTKLIQMLYVADLRTGESRPLWDAPLNRRKPLNVRWGSGSSVLIWPTFVPLTDHSDEAALDGTAAAEIDLETGQWRQISVDGIEAHASSGTPRTAAAAPVSVELRQSMTMPPRLYARDGRSGEEREIYDLNPRFGREIALAMPQFVHWEDAAGRRWKGRFYPPLDVPPGRRSALVIQTHGYAGPNEFSIYGPGDGAPSLGPGWSVYLAQPLATRGIAVLQVGGPESSTEDITELERMKQVEAGIRAAVEHLAEVRMIDREKVGIMGHSATGRHVEHLLAFSPFQFAAAIAGDYADGNYLQSALYGWPDFGAQVNGAVPFAEGLSRWLESSPAFNAHRIRTPLQINLTTPSEGFGTLLWGWEMFSRLRYLEKPVEYYVVPDLERGSHMLQNPRQLLTLQTRALDWWSFWLQAESSDDPGRAEQYASWRSLREQQKAGRSVSKP